MHSCICTCFYCILGLLETITLPPSLNLITIIEFIKVHMMSNVNVFEHVMENLLKCENPFNRVKEVIKYLIKCMTKERYYQLCLEKLLDIFAKVIK